MITAEQILSSPEFDVEKYIHYIDLHIKHAEIAQLLTTNTEVFLSAILSDKHEFLKLKSNRDIIKPELFYEISRKYGHKLYVKSKKYHTNYNRHITPTKQILIIENNNHKYKITFTAKTNYDNNRLIITTLNKNKKIKIPYDYDEYDSINNCIIETKHKPIVQLRNIILNHFIKNIKFYKYVYGTPNQSRMYIAISDGINTQGLIYDITPNADQIMVETNDTSASFPLNVNTDNINAIINFIVNTREHSSLLRNLKLKIPPYKN